jgi:hypothetical protein
METNEFSSSENRFSSSENRFSSSMTISNGPDDMLEIPWNLSLMLDKIYSHSTPSIIHSSLPKLFSSTDETLSDMHQVIIFHLFSFKFIFVIVIYNMFLDNGK